MAAAGRAQQLGRVLARALSPPHAAFGAPPPGVSVHAVTAGLCWWHAQGPLRALGSAAGGTSQPAAPAHSSDPSSSSSSSSSSQPDTPNSSSDSGAPGSSPAQADGDGYVAKYEGFFSRPHKRLKYASLLNTFASFAAAPLIVTYSSASPVARVAVSVSVLAFAIITTGGLHWFTSPYVHRLLYNAKTDTARVQTLRFLGGSRWHEFPVSAAQAPTGYHPLASFKVSGKTFYVDPANFSDAVLLRRLAPDSSDAADAPQEQPPAAGGGPGGSE